jgi:hypothetical protein
MEPLDVLDGQRYPFGVLATRRTLIGSMGVDTATTVRGAFVCQADLVSEGGK